MDKNGYYWYQLFVNGSSYQPSQYAWFYADNTDSCNAMQIRHFNIVSEALAQCANATNVTFTVAPPAMVATLTMTASTTTDTTMEDLLSTVAPNMTETGIYYAIGVLITLVLLLVILATIILLMFIFKEHRQKKGESFTY